MTRSNKSRDRQADGQRGELLDKDQRVWCSRALAGLYGLCSNKHHGAWRNSAEISPGAAMADYRPTASCHALIAFHECGVRVDEPATGLLPGATPPVGWTSNVRSTSELDLSELKELSSADQVMDTLLRLGGVPTASAGGASGPRGAWASEIINLSIHGRGPATTPAPNEAILHGHLLPGLFILWSGIAEQASRGRLDNARVVALRDPLVDGLEVLTRRAIDILRLGGTGVVDEVSLADQPRVTPYLMLNVTLALEARLRLAQRWSDFPLPSGLAGDFEAARGSLRGYFARQVDRLMARRDIPEDPDYDATSLVFALRGLTVFEPGVRHQPFFGACLQAVVRGQMEDGCWPNGVSTSRDPGTDTIQHPSVEIALQLAKCAFHKSILYAHDRAAVRLVELVLPALARQARYLRSTFREVPLAGCMPPKVSGWCSDRVRSPRLVETWITALAARLFHAWWLCERSRTRSRILSRFNAPALPAQTGPGERHEPWDRATWDAKFVDLDDVTRPADALYTRVVEPIRRSANDGNFFLRPAAGGISFIIYGPPGSGKTHGVKTLGSALGWPLVSLNPGHFIRDGLELIEASASRIFADLMALDHAVVFFDECDELFRDRASSQKQHRNILSFATASMLPKLQELHDSGKVVFLVATNFLSNIDQAIRRSGRFDARLLFDRSHDQSRLAIVRKKMASTWDAARIDQAVKDTRGYSFPEINEYMAGTRGASTLESIEDYLEWCIHHGENELTNAQAARDVRQRYIDYWGRLPGYSDKKATAPAAGGAATGAIS